MLRARPFAFSGLVALLAACGGAPTEATTPTATTAATEPATPSPGASEALLRDGAKKVLACKPEAPLGTPAECEAYVEWFHLEPIEKGHADPVLVAMLDDANPVLVELAAQTLERGDHAFPKDKALAERLLAKLESTTDLAVQQPLAHAAATIEPETTGLGERLVEASKKLPPAARAEFVLAAQQKSPATYHASTVEVAKASGDEELRRAALRSLFGGLTSGKEQEICELWTSVAEDAKAPENLSAVAADLATTLRQSPCSAQYARILKAIGARVRGKKVEVWEWAAALGHLANDNPAVQPSQVKEAVTLMKGLAEGPGNGTSVRVMALEALAAADPAMAKPVLVRLAKDRDPELAKRAGELAAKAK